MFKRIKLLVIKGRQLIPFMVAKVLQDHEDRLVALETAASSGSDSGSGSGDNTNTNTDSGSGDNTNTNTEQTEATLTNVSFTILNDNTPIEGATVTIGSVSSTTGSAGGCTLQGIPMGSQEVTVTKEGFTTKTETITVTENASITIDDFMAEQVPPSG